MMKDVDYTTMMWLFSLEGPMDHAEVTPFKPANLSPLRFKSLADFYLERLLKGLLPNLTRWVGGL